MQFDFRGDRWRVEFATFRAMDVLNITGLPQPHLRMWRKRGYLPQKDSERWAEYDVAETLDAYLLHAFSKLGVAPSDSVGLLGELSGDLLFHTITSGDGACSFRGPDEKVEALRYAFDDSLEIARMIAKPRDERRFVMSTGGPSIWRVGDLAELTDEERLEYFLCIDLITAGRHIADRAGRSLLSFTYEGGDEDVANVRRLSHGNVARLVR